MVEQKARDATMETVALTPAYVRDILSSLDADRTDDVCQLLAKLHPADIADVLGLVRRDEQRELLECVAPDLLPDILTELDEHLRDNIVQELASKT